MSSCRGGIDRVRLGPTEDDYVKFEEQRERAVDRFVARILKGVDINARSPRCQRMKVTIIAVLSFAAGFVVGAFSPWYYFMRKGVLE